MKHNNHGFSLIETVVAMAILGAFTVSICSCLMLSLRMNEKADSLMQEQMAVSSAVETLMAEGYSAYTAADIQANFGVTVEIGDNEDESLPYCEVTLTKETVSVKTQVRKAVG